jgi:tetratricopeptide (TPR) repeat protein
VELAHDVLLQSLHLFPCNWSAWQLLATLVPDHTALLKLTASSPLQSYSSEKPTIPHHWLRHFFYAHFSLSLPLSPPTQLLTHLDELNQYFPYSTQLLQMTALTHYHAHQFDAAAILFSTLYDIAPHCMDHIDTYSNILYVREERSKLSFLAHELSTREKFREETYIVIGNYYSLKGNHEKAILSFRRALTLNSSNLSAWTLMGHEYVEFHNHSAAMECYRSAIALNPRDFRAWYGLGQVYELIGMTVFALYYFQHAVELRPWDSRMWCAMAECYEKLKKENEAIQCWRRAEDCEAQKKNRGETASENIARMRLAKLYAERHDHRMAAFYYQRILEQNDENNARLDHGIGNGNLLNDEKEGIIIMNENDNDRDPETEEKDELNDSLPSDSQLPSNSDTIEALMFLAEYYRSIHQYERANQYCQRLRAIGGATTEAARSLIAEINHAMLTEHDIRNDEQGQGCNNNDDDDDDDEEEEDNHNNHNNHNRYSSNTNTNTNSNTNSHSNSLFVTPNQSHSFVNTRTPIHSRDSNVSPSHLHPPHQSQLQHQQSQQSQQHAFFTPITPAPRQQRASQQPSSFFTPES